MTPIPPSKHSDPDRLPLEITPIGLNFLLKSMGYQMCNQKLRCMRLNEFLHFVDKIQTNSGKIKIKTINIKIHC